MKAITSRDNARLKALRALLGDSRQQRESGRTILDGPHLVATYREKVGLPELLVVSESGLERSEVAALVAAHVGTETLLLRDALFKELSGVGSPVGILSVIPIPPQPSGPVPGGCIMLDAVQDAGNVGTILRTAAAAGIREVLLGNGCAGAWTPRVLRAGQGAHFGLAIREHLDLCQMADNYDGAIVAAVASGGQSLYSLDLSRPVAWLFGNEGAGLAPALLDKAAVRARIPMAAGCESMNVAAAAAVCLFEGVRQQMTRESG